MAVARSVKRRRATVAALAEKKGNGPKRKARLKTCVSRLCRPNAEILCVLELKRKLFQGVRTKREKYRESAKISKVATNKSAPTVKCNLGVVTRRGREYAAKENLKKHPSATTAPSETARFVKERCRARARAKVS